MISWDLMVSHEWLFSWGSLGLRWLPWSACGAAQPGTYTTHFTSHLIRNFICLLPKSNEALAYMLRRKTQESEVTIEGDISRGSTAWACLLALGCVIWYVLLVWDSLGLTRIAPWIPLPPLASLLQGGRWKQNRGGSLNRSLSWACLNIILYFSHFFNSLHSACYHIYKQSHYFISFSHS